MAEIEIFWSEIAINQRKDIVKYWNKRNGNSNYSNRLNGLINNKLNTLKLHPKIGTLIENFDARMLHIENFGLVYQLKTNQVRILAFWDQRQDPEKLLELLKS